MYNNRPLNQIGKAGLSKRVLNALTCELSTSELAEKLKVKNASITFTCMRLRDRGLVVKRKEGVVAFWKLSNS